MEPTTIDNNKHYLHLVIYLVVFSILLGIAVWMYASYTNKEVMITPSRIEAVKESSASFKPEDKAQIEASMEASEAQFSPEDGNNLKQSMKASSASF